MSFLGSYISQKFFVKTNIYRPNFRPDDFPEILARTTIRSTELSLGWFPRNVWWARSVCGGLVCSSCVVALASRGSRLKSVPNVASDHED